MLYSVSVVFANTGWSKEEPACEEYGQVPTNYKLKLIKPTVTISYFSELLPQEDILNS